MVSTEKSMVRAGVELDSSPIRTLAFRAKQGELPENRPTQEEADADTRGNVQEAEAGEFPFAVTPGLNLPIVPTYILDERTGKRRPRDVVEMNTLTQLCRDRIEGASGRLITIVATQIQYKSATMLEGQQLSVPGLLFAFEVPEAPLPNPSK